MKTLMTRNRQRAVVFHFLQAKVHQEIEGDSKLIGNDTSSSFSSTLSPANHHQHLSSSSYVITIVFGAIFILTASILNIHDLYVLWKFRKRWSSTHVFFFALALSDLFVALLAMPGFIVFTTHHDTWPLGVDLCLTWLYFDWITTLTTSAFVMVIFLSHVIPFYLTKTFINKLSKCKRVLAISAAMAIFIYTNCLFLPVYVHESVAIYGMKNSESVCFVQSYQYSEWLIAYYVFGCYVPVFVIVVCSLVIGRQFTSRKSKYAQRHRPTRFSSSSSKSKTQSAENLVNLKGEKPQLSRAFGPTS
jgi:7 transmembrane receptor (rhodopsin family)